MKERYNLPAGVRGHFALGVMLERVFRGRIPGGSKALRAYLENHWGMQVSKATACRMIRDLKDMRGEP